MFPKFLWLDNTDSLLCKDKINALKNKLSSWLFLKWDETEFPNPKEAFSVLLGHIHTSSMFEEGKVIYTYGLPSFHADLSNELEKIPNNTMLVIISRPDSRTILYKKASQLQYARIEDPLNLKDRTQALEWLIKRCESLNINIERTAAIGLIDFIGINPDILLMEAKKISHLTNDKIYPWAVEQACSGTGDARTTEIMTYMVEGQIDKAHEMLERTLALREPPIRILALIALWLRRIYLAKSGEQELSKIAGSIDTLKSYLDRFRKYNKPEKDSSIIDSLENKMLELDIEDPKRQKVKQKIDAEKIKLKPSSELMFANPWAIKYAIKEYSLGTKLREKNNLNNDWPREMIRFLMDIQIAARSGKDISAMLHDILMYFDKGSSVCLNKK